MAVARAHRHWLKSDADEACEAVREDAAQTGAWSRDEIDSWTNLECLAYFVQTIASELRNCLDADNSTICESVALYNTTDWDKESEYPIGVYYMREGVCLVDWCVD